MERIAGRGTVVQAAAFRRLCVETILAMHQPSSIAQPPSGGCVLKLETDAWSKLYEEQPTSGGCVLKHATNAAAKASYGSRLRAAVC